MIIAPGINISQSIFLVVVFHGESNGLIILELGLSLTKIVNIEFSLSASRWLSGGF